MDIVLNKTLIPKIDGPTRNKHQIYLFQYNHSYKFCTICTKSWNLLSQVYSIPSIRPYTYH